MHKLQSGRLLLNKSNILPYPWFLNICLIYKSAMLPFFLQLSNWYISYPMSRDLLYGQHFAWLLFHLQNYEHCLILQWAIADVYQTSYFMNIASFYNWLQTISINFFSTSHVGKILPEYGFLFKFRNIAFFHNELQ